MTTFIEEKCVCSQTCIKRSALIQRKTGLSKQVILTRGSIHMKFSMTGDCIGRFDCISF
jgi:hypothetical protein